MFKYFLLFLFIAVEANAGQPYYYYSNYWNGRYYEYQYYSGVRRDAIEKENDKLDLAERRYELENRKNEMRRRGILPQLPPPAPRPNGSSIGFQGQKYANMAQLRASPAWHQAMADVKARHEAEDLEKEKAKQHSLHIIATKRYMSSVDIARQENLRRANEIINRGK